MNISTHLITLPIRIIRSYISIGAYLICALAGPVLLAAVAYWALGSNPIVMLAIAVLALYGLEHWAHFMEATLAQLRWAPSRRRRR